MFSQLGAYTMGTSQVSESPGFFILIIDVDSTAWNRLHFIHVYTTRKGEAYGREKYSTGNG
ncbi:hypothetical protein GCM10011389_06690 [Pontibacillus salipaludis]|uniref:Uncharacterized protein n=1 Tax=Pontibacillus salipaludis TaxID=1697394 RepID=A0ABQ1PR97_9BACI|nr:hypothetical protein GCM10011389_06690 [Pontibacillus salipaludis]